MSEQDARDIAQMNGAVGGGSEVPVAKSGRKFNLLWVVLGCVVVGVTLGIVVYQQSLKKPTPKASPTPKPSVVAKASPVPSPVAPEVSAVNAEPKSVSFPKAGQLRVFYQGGGANDSWLALGITMQDEGGNSKTVSFPAGKSTTPMKVADTGFTLAAAGPVTINSYWGTDPSKLSIGWAKPASNNCGFNGFGVVSIASYVTWATEQAKGEPIVSVQCWGDWSPNPADTSSKDFNDYTLIWTYVASGASASPSSSLAASSSPAASVAPSPSPSPSPSATITPSPSPSPSVAASSTTGGTVTPTPSSRAAMPDTSEGVPVTGVFEVTVGTVSVGLILLVLGLLGLLAL